MKYAGSSRHLSHSARWSSVRPGGQGSGARTAGAVVSRSQWSSASSSGVAKASASGVKLIGESADAIDALLMSQVGVAGVEVNLGLLRRVQAEKLAPPVDAPLHRLEVLSVAAA